MYEGTSREQKQQRRQHFLNEMQQSQVQDCAMFDEVLSEDPYTAVVKRKDESIYLSKRSAKYKGRIRS